MTEGAAFVRPGDIVAGKYRVERLLGMGAMGVVVAAMHVELQERRALKLMLPSKLGDQAGVERFMREARAAARLRSEHVAMVHDIGRLESGVPYIVMEYLEGTDLKALLDERGRISVEEAIHYVLQACVAIAEAHALGIIHRDLKPANLFATKTVLKVVDFGIAKVVRQTQDELEITGASEMLGTPLYMSPEQMRGATSVDARTDIWALGAILYRMLTGQTPFTGSSITEICAAVVADDPPPPRELAPDIPPELEAVIMKCLEKKPEKRYATVNELRAAIAPFFGARGFSKPAPAEPASAAETKSSKAADPVATGSATLNNTAQASSWAQPSPVAPGSPPPRSNLAGKIVIVALGTSALAAGALAVWKNPMEGVVPRRTGASSSASAEASAVSSESAQPSTPTVEVSAATTTTTISVPTSASAAASAAASASTSASPSSTTSTTGTTRATAARPPPPPPPPPLPPIAPPPPRDAFGRERK